MGEGVREGGEGEKRVGKEGGQGSEGKEEESKQRLLQTLREEDKSNRREQLSTVDAMAGPNVFFIFHCT